MLNSAFLYSFQSNKETENQMFKIGLGRIGCLLFVNDANRFFAVFVAITTFMWFKNLSITHNKLINVIGSTTFGVLLIHANSDAMRTWLWENTLNVVGHYSLPLFELTAYSFTITIVVFITC